ncbi:hypothetical protein ARMSODRAFT_1018271 [Armillaria solidipes]|uniref:Uncharacterized protein n=1 Tax=Armillaria solidipes TaxID=1076256 RepID=A0A2H3BT76_9AGAR|nr:hypothetical protein ARMSODRAFT_1018271 [Armillaria solidipes]
MSSKTSMSILAAHHFTGREALRASYLDIFLLGLGAMTMGYVFCVENPATVSYLQAVGHRAPRHCTRASKSIMQRRAVLPQPPPLVVLCCRCPCGTLLHRRARAYWRCGSAAGCSTGFSGSRSFGVVHVIEAHKCGHHQTEELESWKGLPEQAPMVTFNSSSSAEIGRYVYMDQSSTSRRAQDDYGGAVVAG